MCEHVFVFLCSLPAYLSGMLRNFPLPPVRVGAHPLHCFALFARFFLMCEYWTSFVGLCIDMYRDCRDLEKNRAEYASFAALLMNFARRLQCKFGVLSGHKVCVGKAGRNVHEICFLGRTFISFLFCQGLYIVIANIYFIKEPV